MSWFFSLFLRNGLNDPGQQVAPRVIEVKEFNDYLFGFIQTFFPIQLFAHTNILAWRYEWLFHVEAILDTSHMNALRMERMYLLIKCSRIGDIRFMYLAFVASFYLDEVGNLFPVVSHLSSLWRARRKPPPARRTPL